MATVEYQRRIHWLRARAEEIRTFSESMHHAEPKAAMDRMAETYEKLAQHLEAMVDGKPFSNIG